MLGFDLRPRLQQTAPCSQSQKAKEEAIAVLPLGSQTLHWQSRAQRE